MAARSSSTCPSRPDDTSYGSELHRLIQAKPQVIFTESDPQTDATAFGSLKLFGAHIPIFGTNATVIPQWLKAVSKVLGSAQMGTYYRGVEPYAPNFPGTRYFNQALLADAKQVPQPSQWLGQEYATAPFDGLIIYALAMTEAHSTNPSRLQQGHPQRDGTRRGQDGRLLLQRRRGGPQGR